MRTVDTHLTKKYNPFVLLTILLVMSMISERIEAATMNDYCSIPPFVAQTVPPLVMLDTDKSHKLYYQAYNDAADLNEDGHLDIRYTHNIDYYGYFDSYKCYLYNATSGLFTPAATTTTKFCSSNTQWSGNVLNWLTMSRMDVVRKVLYGGSRSTDTSTSTILERAYITMDAHSWGKELTGRLCNSGTTYTNGCSTSNDCSSGYSCVDVQAAGNYLTPYATSTAPTTCTSSAVTTSQSGKIMVARYQHSSAKNCGVNNTQGMINSYEPGNLFHPSTGVANVAGTSSMVDYVTSFADSSLASNDFADNYNIFAVTNFTADVSGDWQFAVDGDDDTEVQVGGTVVATNYGCKGFSGNQNYSGTITLTAGTTYTLVARHFEKGGGEGVQVWFKRPGATTWNYVSSVLSSSSCTANAMLPADTAGKILVARYTHSGSKSCGVGSTAGMLSSYEPANLFHPATGVANVAGTSTSVDYVTGFDDYSLDPTSRNYADNYNIIAVTKFRADVSGIWTFAVDGDDDVEVQVNGVVVAQYLGCHGASNGQSYSGTIVLTNGTTYTLVARHFEQGGQEGVRVWFQRPGSSTWLYVNSTNLTLSAPTIVTGNECAIESGAFISSGTPSTGTTFDLNAALTLSAPTIASGNECAIKTTGFITTGVPTAGATVTSGSAMQNLFCNTTPTNGTDPLLRVVPNMPNRIWDWSAKERPECTDPTVGGYPFSTAPDDYKVRVKVCDSGVGLETNCKKYGTSYKPTGLLQKYGEGDGSKVCSKNYSKACTTAITDSSDCATGEGLCIYKAPIYFGMISGSYMNNLSGGVLRKNLGSMLDEVNLADGTFISSYHGIVNTYQNLKLVGYNSDFSWQGSDGGTCGWIETRSMQNGECRNWGNPLGEMMYETLRYFAGKGAPTSDFEYSATYDTMTVADGGLYLPHPSWGYKKGSTTYQPYDIFPTCSKPFMLILSDISPNYDSDQIPGSSFKKTDNSYFTEDSLTPQLGLGVQTAGVSLLNKLTDIIGSNEPSASSPIVGNSWYIGQSTSGSGSTVIYDSLCSSKNVEKLSLIQGLCPEEPTKKGSYYTAALAYYGKTLFNTNTGKPNVTTYAVAMASPIADFKIKAGSGTVTIVPTGKSVSGCLSVRSACADKCTLSYDATGHGLTMSACSTDAFCPTDQIVNFFVDDIRYDTSTTPPTVTYLNFRINYEDSEQGADHDMDTIIKYEVCTQAAINAAYGSCTGTSTTLGSNIQIKLSVDYGAGCIDQVLGFIISGTTDDGVFLPVKDGDVPDSETGDTPAVVAAMPKTWSKIFTPNNTPTDFLKNPLWYAAKWGGFNDSNAPTDSASLATYTPKPDLVKEWAKNDGITPDNYFLVVNPLKLESQLDKALINILSSVSSGTAASILNNSEGSGANLLQAVFYPLKDFGGNLSNNAVGWIGELQNLWYYVDPTLNNSTIREDTNQDNVLNLKQDYITKFYFDSDQNQTLVHRYVDSQGNGLADLSMPVDTVSPDNVKSLWKAGRLLWERNLTTSPRTIYTHTGNGSFDDGTTGFTPFTSASTSLKADATFRGYLQVADATEAAKLMDYVQGIDQTGYRARKVTISGCGLSDTSACTREWKLGDIVSSTPKLVSNVKLNTYDLAPPTGYSDSSYYAYTQTSTYLHRGMAFVGANDGMLHAFNLGVLKERADSYNKAEIDNTSGSLAGASDNLGKEMWAFIPKNALPYLRYLTCVNGSGDTTYCGNVDYNHLFMVDRTPVIIDASVLIPTVTTTCTTATDYSTCDKLADGSTWTTVLIGGMGFGASNRFSTDACTAGANGTCIKTPIATSGLSSYFALDVKDPANPKYMWEFNGDPASNNFLGASTTGPAIVRIKSSGGATKNGKWFAVFASGPTGPIDTTKHQFLGTSSQNLKLFVVDLKSGALLRTIDTGVANAFAGTLSSAVIDTDRSQAGSPGFYSDDAVYIGYTKMDTSVTPNSWTKGGVLRLLTKENPDPAQWTVSTVIDNTGPVTTTITKLQDRSNSTLWLYFGTGRYFYKSDDTSTTVQQQLYGIKDPCYSTANRQAHTPLLNVAGGTLNDNDPACADAVSGSLVDQSGDATHAPAATLSATAPGWFINLDTANTASLSERDITDPVALTNGNVFFTTFKPSADICKFGGDSLIWAVRYNTGGIPPSSTMQGSALMQVSTGAFAEVKLATAFANPGNLRLDGRRLTNSIQGVPPTAQGLSLITNPKPVKKYLHVQEK